MGQFNCMKVANVKPIYKLSQKALHGVHDVDPTAMERGIGCIVCDVFTEVTSQGYYHILWLLQLTAVFLGARGCGLQSVSAKYSFIISYSFATCTVYNIQGNLISMF